MAEPADTSEWTELGFTAPKVVEVARQTGFCECSSGSCKANSDCEVTYRFTFEPEDVQVNGGAAGAILLPDDTLITSGESGDFEVTASGGCDIPAKAAIKYFVDPPPANINQMTPADRTITLSVKCSASECIGRDCPSGT